MCCCLILLSVEFPHYLSSTRYSFTQMTLFLLFSKPMSLIYFLGPRFKCNSYIIIRSITMGTGMVKSGKIRSFLGNFRFYFKSFCSPVTVFTITFFCFGLQQLLREIYVSSAAKALLCSGAGRQHHLLFDTGLASAVHFQSFFLVPVALENGSVWKSWAMLSFYAHSVAVLLQHKIRQHSSWEFPGQPLAFSAIVGSLEKH